MDDDDTTGRWVPVYVPVELASDVLRRVAAHLETGGAAVGPSEWADASEDDVAAFFGSVSQLEWRLVAELARREAPTTVAELAEALDVKMGSVAGAMGPVNKRARREGWAPPIEPRRFSPPGSSGTRRGLVLAAGLRGWIDAQRDTTRVGAGLEVAGAGR